MTKNNKLIILNLKKGSLNNNNQKRYTFDACKSRPCTHDSFCESLPNAQFKCHCSLSKSGHFCENEYSSFMFPEFKNYSYLELHYKEKSFNDFSLQIEFKTSKLNGLIFFASQSPDGSGNLLALILRDGFIEMRIDNPGDDFKTYVLPNSIKIGKFHRLFIQKRKSFLLMQLDDFLPFQDKISISSVSIHDRIVLGNIQSLNRFSHK